MNSQAERNGDVTLTDSAVDGLLKLLGAVPFAAMASDEDLAACRRDASQDPLDAALRRHREAVGSLETSVSASMEPRRPLGRFFGAVSGTHWPSVVSAIAAQRQIALGMFAMTSALLWAAVASATLLALDIADLPVAVVAGFVAGVASITLDRFLLAQPTPERFRQRAVRVLPRLLIALPLAYCVTEPLMTVVYRSEVDAVVSEQRSESLDAALAASARSVSAPADRQRDRIKSELTGLDQAERESQARIDELTERLDRERAGTGASGLTGVGPVSRALQDQLEAEVSRLTLIRQSGDERRAELNFELAEITSAELAREHEFSSDAVDETERLSLKPVTLVERLAALDQLAVSPHVIATRMLLMMLLLGVSLGAAFMKLSAPSSYDWALLAHEDAAAAAERDRLDFAAELRRELAALERLAAKSEAMQTVQGLVPVSTSGVSETPFDVEGDAASSGITTQGWGAHP